MKVSSSKDDSTNQRAMPVLPDAYVQYKRTPLFTQDTIPKGFLREHSTKPNVWGVLNIESGALVYHITAPGFEAKHVLGPNKNGVIVPEQKHHIETAGAVRFYLEFYRPANAD